MFSVFAFETLLHYVDFDYEIHNSKDEDENEYLALCLIDKGDVYLGGKDTYTFPIYNLDSVQDAVEAAIDRLDNYWFDYLKDESEKWKAENPGSDCDECLLDKKYVVFQIQVSPHLIGSIVFKQNENFVFGKTVFLSREDAERALKEREKNGNEMR